MLNRFRLVHFLVAYLVFMSASPAGAAERERRTFVISVGGKQSGSYEMTIQKREDGSHVMTAKAEVSVRVLLIHYRYTYRGTEVWKDGRLQSLESTSDDDGKKFTVVPG